MQCSLLRIGSFANRKPMIPTAAIAPSNRQMPDQKAGETVTDSLIFLLHPLALFQLALVFRRRVHFAGLMNF